MMCIKKKVMQFKNSVKINEDHISVLEIVGTSSKGGMENYMNNLIKISLLINLR